MKKFMKKSVSVLLALIIIVGTMIIAVPPEGIDWALEAEAASNLVVGGVTLDYADGDYFTDNGKECSDHSTKGIHSSTNESRCNCKCSYNGRILGACQCFGFARYVQYKMFGIDSYNNSASFKKIAYNGSIYVAAGTLTANKIKGFINNAGIGAHIRTNKDSKGNLHSMIVSDITDTGFSIVHCNGSTNSGIYSGHDACRIGTYTFTWQSYVSSTYGKRGIQYIELPSNYNASDYNNPENSTPSAPTYANISASAENIAVGSSISLYAASDHATSYKLWITDASTGSVIKTITSSQDKFSVSGLAKGKYRAYVTAINSAGYIDSKSVSFSVAAAPTSASMSVSKNIYGLGEKVNFSFSANEIIAKYTVVISDRSNWKVVKKNVVKTDTYSTVDLPAGEYDAYVIAENAAGYVDSNHVKFTVTDKLEAAVSISANEFEVGDTVKFGFSGNLGGKYKIWISNADSWELVHTATTASASYSINTLPNGNYTAYVTAMNDSGYYVDSDPVYFSIASDAWVNVWQKSTVYAVGETCTFNFDSNINASKYKVWISDTSDWSLVHTSGQISGTTYSISTLPEGNYSAYVTAINEFSQVDSAQVQFTVTQKDQWAALYVNRKEYLPDENIEFGFASNISNKYTLWVSDVSDWSLVRKVTVSGSSYNINDLPVGEYCAYTTAYDSSTNVDSARVYFKVCAAPSVAAISADKNEVTPNDKITFSFTSDTAVNYKIWITDTSTWELYYSGKVEGSSYTTTLPAGNYEVYVTAYNRAGSIDSSVISVTSSDEIDEVELIMSKPVYLLGETVEGMATYIHDAVYVLTLTDVTNDKVYVMELDSCNISLNDLSAGDYKAFITAQNSVSAVESEEVIFSIVSVPITVSAKYQNRVSTLQSVEFEITTDCIGKCTYEVIISDDEYNIVAMAASDTNVVEISGIEAGTYNVYVSVYNDFGIVKEETAPIEVYSTDVSLECSELKLKVGDTYTFTPTLIPADTADDLFWYADEPEGEDPVAIIDENGKLTANRPGTTTVVAAIGEKYQLCEVTVSYPETTVKLDASEAVITPEESLTLKVSVEPKEMEDTLVWSSSDERIATVDGNGKIIPHALGTAVITATAGDVSASCTIEVIPPITLKAMGGSVRIVEPYGLRFGIQLVKDDAYNEYKDVIVSYGTLIIPKKNLGDTALTFEVDNVKDVPAVNIYSEDSTQLTYTGVLVGIPKSSFYSDIVGRGYLKYNDIDGNEKVIYTDEIVRSYYQVADSAYKRYGAMTDRDATEQAVYEKLAVLLAEMTDGDNLTTY